MQLIVRFPVCFKVALQSCLTFRPLAALVPLQQIGQSHSFGFAFLLKLLRQPSEPEITLSDPRTAFVYASVAIITALTNGADCYLI